jgi:hypothetical protein
MHLTLTETEQMRFTLKVALNISWRTFMLA